MAKRFGWLDRAFGESVSDYDRRINELAAFHAGYAFLTWQNYCEEYSAFAVYVLWNGECNAKLVSPMPAGGFMMHCDPTAARELAEFAHGLPVFIKLYAKRGLLHVEQMAVADNDMVYDLYFNGCECIAPEGLCFADTDEPGPDVTIGRPAPAEGAGSVRASSFRGSYFRGSYRGGSFIRGSYRKGSYLTGSYRSAGGSYIHILSGGAGSYSRSAGLSSSYLSWLFGAGSYRYLLFGGSGMSRFFGGSMAVRYVGGSYTYGSFLAGSYRFAGMWSGLVRRGSFMTGSWYGGSYQSGSFIRGGFAEVVRRSEAAHGVPEAQEGVALRRLIEELGYGLDLI